MFDPDSPEVLMSECGMHRLRARASCERSTVWRRSVLGTVPNCFREKNPPVKRKKLEKCDEFYDISLDTEARQLGMFTRLSYARSLLTGRDAKPYLMIGKCSGNHCEVVGHSSHNTTCGRRHPDLRQYAN